METPPINSIEKNLAFFMNKWENIPNNPISAETLHEIANIRQHIKKGCLSGVPPGYGTERNENLHHLLNRCLLVGASYISVELASAVVTLLFYSRNSQRKNRRDTMDGKHVVVSTPIQGFQSTTNQNNSTINTGSEGSKSFPSQPRQTMSNQTATDQSSLQTTDPFIVVAESVADLCNDNIAAVTAEECCSLYKVLNNINDVNTSRAFNAFDIPYASYNSSGYVLGKYEEFSIPGNDGYLSRNLASFGLEIDSVPGDGDCAFRSIIRQLHAHINVQENDALNNHVKALNLGKSENEDTFTLRQLFVDKLQQCDPKISDFLAFSDVEDLFITADQFRCPGIFDNRIGDVVVKVCSQVLKVTIIVLTSFESAPCLPFLSESPLTTNSIYIAFHSEGVGHYDSTKPVYGK
jgi:hypothetical protein